MPDDDLDPRELVLLTTCRDNVEVMGVRSVLEAENIGVFVQGEHHRAIEGPLLGAMIELRVFVPRGDLEDARALLEEVEYAEHLPADDAPPDEEDRSVHRFLEERATAPERFPDPELPVGLSPRKPGLAVLFAVLFPIGAGHIYARRPGTAAAIAAMMALTGLLWLFEWHVWRGAVSLVALDAFGAVFAIRRDRAAAKLQ